MILLYNIIGDYMQNNKNIFSKIIRFQYQGKTYEMFQNDDYQIAFLEVTQDNKYYYPSYDTLVSFLRIFSKDSTIKFITNKKRKKVKFKPALIIGASTVFISSLLLSKICIENHINTQHVQNFALEYGSNSEEDFYITEDYQLVKSSKRITVYDTDCLTYFLGYENPDVQTIIDYINSSKKFDTSMKEFLIEYVSTLCNYYPDLELRIFYENLKTLKIRSFTNEEELLIENSVSAFYNVKENEIALREGINLTEGTRDIMALRHELGHAFNSLYKYEAFGYEISFDFTQLGHGNYAEEALTCLFTTLPYYDRYNDDVKKNFGYPLQTNLYQLIIESLPNYNCSMLISNNISYLENCMDEYMSDIADARVINELIDIQANDRLNGNGITIDDTEYDDIYYYIATLYVRNNLNEDMTKEEFFQHKEHFLDILQRGIVGEYFYGTDELDTTYINTDIVEKIFDNYAINILGFNPDNRVSLKA